jgi:hypothetical protein
MAEWDTKTVLTSGLIAACGFNAAFVRGDVPGEPLTVMTGALMASSSNAAISVGSGMVTIPNLQNLYPLGTGDFVLPAPDLRPSKILK